MQLGYRNHYGHPSAEVVERYGAHGALVARSDESGAVQWRFAATGTTVECWRRGHARYWFNQPAAARAGQADPCTTNEPDVAWAMTPAEHGAPAPPRR